MHTQTHKLDRAFESIVKAYETKTSMNPLTDTYPDLTIEDAYLIQQKYIESLVEQGKQIVGKKIGLTSEAMQQMLGVNEPDYGYLLDSMEILHGDVIQASTLFQPKIEGEIAFVLNQDLIGPGITKEDVLEATEYIVPALEIVDSRITEWKITLADTIADNASCGMFIKGEKKINPNDINMEEIHMQLLKNGEKVNEGFGEDVLGHPATCVAWLANKLSEYNVSLKKGEVILSGALSAAVEMNKGDCIKASFTELGEVEVKIK